MSASASQNGRDPLSPDASELWAARERLTERFALMQSELGGLFYEMAIRDHLELDLLGAKAAALQQVDTELNEVQRRLDALGAGSNASS